MAQEDERTNDGLEDTVVKEGRLKRLASSDGAKYVGGLTLLGLAAGTGIYFFKKFFYDNKTEDTQRKIKRYSVDALGGAAGVAITDAVNPHKDRADNVYE